VRKITQTGNTDFVAFIKFIVIGFGQWYKFLVVTEVLHVFRRLWLKQATNFGGWMCLYLQVDQGKVDLLCRASWKELA